MVPVRTFGKARNRDWQKSNPDAPKLSSRPVISTSVRDLVAFVLRSGDLGGAGGFGGRNRALEGTRGHQRLQKNRPANYEAEVPVRWRVEQETFIFELKGRIDGVLVQAGLLRIEEIKTVRRSWSGPPDSLHLAQARVYAYLYSLDHPGFSAATIEVTYLELASGDTVQHEEVFSIDALKDFFDSLIAEYLDWIRRHQAWKVVRDASIGQLAFPFKEYRAGQRALAVAVYRTVRDGGKLFAEAPTGIGKTVSVLFPVIKALAEGRVEKVFYLTARTIGRAVAQGTLCVLRSGGLRLRAVTLTAKDKICFNEGKPCDLTTCPFALGYYDRIKGALQDGLSREVFTRTEIEALARKHTVCPFELSLDLSVWADAVICDYNYVFDPTVSLKRYFDDERHQYAILVDEAHNLIDRAREMFSADLTYEELRTLQQAIAEDLPVCSKILGKICSLLKRLGTDDQWVRREETLVSPSPPEKLGKLLDQFLDEAERWLAQEVSAEFGEPLLALYFRVLSFQRVLDLYDERYVSLCELDPLKLRLFCLDPSTLLKSALKRTGPSVFFSATLRPIEYFREALGGEALDNSLQLSSPFDPKNLSILVANRIPTRLAARTGSYDAVTDSICAVIHARPGNYLVYFSSYAYLTEVLERFRSRSPLTRVVVQSAGMTEGQREEFMDHFQNAPEQTLVAFAVLGGVFGEGIDLLGDRLIGVVVVGVGLPQICLERELIKESFQRAQKNGFD
jgi:DNA excision repair protein ERCC-2